jgi:hypothetical protein
VATAATAATTAGAAAFVTATAVKDRATDRYHGFDDILNLIDTQG